MKCWAFSELFVLWEEGVRLLIGLVGVLYTTTRMNEGGKQMVFKVQQEENPLYGLIGTGMAALS